jgi:soluble lytic murein transglycosylase-like protein
MSPRRRHVRIAGLVVLLAVILAAGSVRYGRQKTSDAQRHAGPKHQPAAPADLASARSRFLESVEALQNGEGIQAIQALESFSFQGRAVEEYRLYYLANALQLTGQKQRARQVLARLWARKPAMIYWQDVGFSLAALYRESGDWHRAAEIYGSIAQRSEHSAVAAAAREGAMTMRFYGGDPGAVVFAARNLLIESPNAAQARDAAAAHRAISGVDEIPLSPAERLERAKNLLGDGHPNDALAALEAVSPWNESSRLDLALQRGIALHRLRRFEDSNKLLEPLTAGPYKYAIPSLQHAARNYASLASAIDPVRTRTVKQRRKVGTKKVRTKSQKTVTRPVYRTVIRTIKTVDKKAKRRKEEYERLRAERLKDLLQVPAERPVRKQTLLTIIQLATAKNQDDYTQELLAELVKIEPDTDLSLQHFWDKAWAAYLRGDHKSAQPLLLFIEQTYSNPNVKRQARYWRARSMERSGRSAEAKAIYTSLANAPYEDLYAKFAKSRGAARAEPEPRTRETRSWPEIAAREMPGELQLAYELNALGMARDARLEIQKNVSDANRRYAEAILSDLFLNSGSHHLGFDYMRRAWPRLATVEQDLVPEYFVDMYYPLDYEGLIRENAEHRDLDPYLVMGLIRQESAYDPEARSRVGATGLMQIMPATGRELAGKLSSLLREPRLTDPQTNIRLGTFYLRQLVDRFGGVEELAIAAYNGGQGNVNKWRRNNRRPLDEFVESIPFSETRNYVKRVTLLGSTYRVRDQARAGMLRATTDVASKEP